MFFLKQSTAETVPLGPALDVDGNEKTALSPTVEVRKKGGSYGARSSASAITHDQNGHYNVPLDGTDTNTLGPLRVKFDDAANHLTVWDDFMVIEAVRYDALFSNSAYLPVDVKAWLNTVPLALNAQRVVARAEDASPASLNATDLKAETAAIKAKTDNLPASPASEGNVTAVGGAVMTRATPADVLAQAAAALVAVRLNQLMAADCDGPLTAGSLVGKTLRFVVGDEQPQPAGVFKVEAGASIVIAANVASVTVTGALAAIASTERQWWLWSLNDPTAGQTTVLARGPFAIRAAVLDV